MTGDDGSGRDQGCLPLGLNSHEAEVNISKPFGPRSAGQMSGPIWTQKV